MTPFDDFSYLINHVLLGEEPTIEDFILLVGTVVAFVAFVLWCCFPIQPKDSANHHRQFSCKTMHSINSSSHQMPTSYTKTSSNALVHNDYILRNGGTSSNGSSSSGGGGCSVSGAGGGHSYHCCT